MLVAAHSSRRRRLLRPRAIRCNSVCTWRSARWSRRRARHHHVDRPTSGIRQQIHRSDSRATGSRLGHGQPADGVLPHRQVAGVGASWAPTTRTTSFCSCRAVWFAGPVARVAWLIDAGLAIRRQLLPEKMLGFALFGDAGGALSLPDSPLYIVTEGTWHPLMLAFWRLAPTTDLVRTAARQQRQDAVAPTSSTDGHSG